VLAASRLRAPGPSTPDAARNAPRAGEGPTPNPTQPHCPSGVKPRCPQTRVRAPRRTPQRAKPHPSAPRAESHNAADKLGCAPRAPASFPERSNATLPTNSGAREAQHASRPSARQTPPAACSEPKRARRLWKTRSRSANKAQTYRELTGQAPATSQQGAIGPAPTSRAFANVSLPPRAARPYQRVRSPDRAAPRALLRSSRSKPATKKTSRPVRAITSFQPAKRARRAAKIFAKERSSTSAVVRPVCSMSARSMAPQFNARRK